MRLAGTLDNQADAQRLGDYLLTLGISTRVLAEGNLWGLWVRDDAHLDRAREELTAFLANRDDPRYGQARRQAVELRRAEQTRDAQARRNLVDMRTQWRSPSPRQTPVLMLLIFASIAITLYTKFGDPKTHPQLQDKLLIADRHERPISLAAVRRGEVWRLVTPIFLHLGFFHLLFNMSLFFRLGSAAETIEGTWRFALLVLFLAVFSNVSQFYLHWMEDWLRGPTEAAKSSPLGAGASGVVYGLFGYVWVRARRDRTSRYFMDDQTVIVMLIWFFLCLFGLVGPIANTAHAAGLVGGMAVGYAVAKLRWRRNVA